MTSQSHILSSLGVSPSPAPSTISAWLAYRAKAIRCPLAEFLAFTISIETPAGSAMWAESGTVMRLYSTTLSCPSNFVFAIFLFDGLWTSNPPDPHWLMTSNSSPVSAKVLSLFFAFEAVEISGIDSLSPCRRALHHPLSGYPRRFPPWLTRSDRQLRWTPPSYT